MSENHIVISDKNSIFIFSKEGHLLKKFGTMGRGPGEYQFIRNLTLMDDSRICFASLYDLFEFNINGDFLNKYKDIFRIDTDSRFSMFCLIDDSLLFCHVQSTKGDASIKAALINKQGRIKQSYRNYTPFTRQKIGIGTEGRAYFYRYNNDIFYKDVYNDTLFQLSKKYELIPKYVFEPGKYKETLSDRAKPFEEQDPTNYIHFNGIFQTKRYIILSYDFGKYFPAKRLTPRVLNLPSGEQVSSLTNTQEMIGVLDQKTKSFVFSKPTNSDNRLTTTGIYNDLDGGPRFVPNEMINDSTMVMFLTATDLKNYLNSNDFKTSVCKYPEKKKELQKLGNGLTEFDNPVLMFVTFNK